MKFWVNLIFAVCCCASMVAAQATATVEAQLKRAVQTAPESFAAHYQLGGFYLQQKQLAAAIPHLEKAQTLDARHYECRYDLALAYVLTGNAAKARAQITATLSLRETAELYALRGEIEEKAGDVHAAATAYHRAAALEPNERHLLSLANLLVKSSNYDEAKTFLDFGLQKYPRSAQLHVGLGLMHYARGQYAEAVKTLCAAVDLAPDDARPYLFLGEMYAVFPDLAEEVTQRMAQFVERHPRDARAHYYYAVNLRHGRPDQRATVDLTPVEQSLLKAIALDAKLPLAHYELGVLYADRQQSAAAIRALQTAIRLQPDLTKAHYRLAQLYQRNGQAQQAARALATFQRLKAQETDTKKY
jgi:Flp pilus assembly protein TadD